MQLAASYAEKSRHSRERCYRDRLKTLEPVKRFGRMHLDDKVYGSDERRLAASLSISDIRKVRLDLLLDTKLMNINESLCAFDVDERVQHSFT